MSGYKQAYLVKLQHCGVRIWDNGKNSAFFFFWPFCFSNCLKYLTEIHIKTKFSFLSSHSSLFIPQSSIPFILLFYGHFITYFVSPWNQLHLQGKDYDPFIFVSPSTHHIWVSTGFRGHSMSDKLTWFLSRIIFYYISNIPA